MKRAIFYIKAAFYHIRENKSYSIFSVIGTALTFLFINIILQVVYSQIADVPPNINTDRILSLSSLKDEKERPLLFTKAEAYAMMSEMKIAEAFQIDNNLSHNVLINEKRYFFQCCYANSGLWQIKKFTLLDGRFFTKEDCENKIPVVVLREGIAKEYFAGSAVGQTIDISNKNFKIIGVVKDYPFQIGSGGMPPAMWIPYTLTTKVEWKVDILFPESVKIDVAKQETARYLNHADSHKFNKDVLTGGDISTAKEFKGKNMESVLIIFSSGIILLLLFIPAINMLTLNLANANNRASEIAIQRAFGATKSSAFLQVILENLMTTIAGAIIGVTLSYPFVSLVEQYLIPPSIEGISLTVGVNLSILLLGVLPLILLLSFISGGLPAYFIAKQNIAITLKGGNK